MHNEENTINNEENTSRQAKPFTFVYIQFPSTKGYENIDLVRQDLSYGFFGYTLVPKVQRKRKRDC